MISDKITLETRKIIGKLFQTKREELGLSRSYVAARCGLNGSQIKNLEEGTKAYTIDTVLRVAYGLNCQLFMSLEHKVVHPDEHDMEQLIDTMTKKK